MHRVFGLVTYFICELIRANLRLALDVATPRYHMKPGIIAVPLDATTDGQILLLSMLINTTPGSVALDVSPDRKILYVHVMYMTTPERRGQKSRKGSNAASSKCWSDGCHACDCFSRRRVSHACRRPPA